MNLVDSSGWLEYFANGKNAGFFASALEDTKNLIVPPICIFEVFKRILQQRSEDEALQAVAVMQQGIIVDLNSLIALNAAKLSLDLRLPMADSVILAAARAFKAVIWTQDIDFQDMENVKFIGMKK